MVPSAPPIAGGMLLVCVAALVCRAEPIATRQVENLAFGVGESLHFSVEYGPIQAGSAVMEVGDRLAFVDGKPCYHVVSRARSSRVFSMFFIVNDLMESFIDVEGIFSRRFSKTIKEGKYETAHVVHYDQDRHLAVSDGDTMEVPPFVQDMLSVIYFVRTQELWPGKKIYIANHSGRKIYPLETRVLRDERVTVPAGTFDCHVVEPFPEAGSFRKKGSLVVWLTKDERKMPVLMISKVFFGSIALKLVSYETSR